MMRRVVVAAAASIAVLISLRLIAPFVTGLALFGVMVWFAVPGVLAAYFLYRPAPGRAFAATLVGPVWGYGVSSVVLLALWIAGMRGPLLLVAPVLAAALGGALAWWIRSSLTPPEYRPGDFLAVCLLIVLVAAVVGRPFARVGEMLPDGKAYRAYFTADFVWRMAVVAELSKGDVPPRNPFLRGEHLEYYWLAHLLPAAVYRETRGIATIEQVLLVNSLGLGIAFMMFFYGFAKQWVRSPAAVGAGCAMTLLCPSFEGIERMVYLWRAHQPLEMLRTLNIDAVTRWVYLSLPVDGLHRLLWYQPHHSTGYAIGLSPLLVLAQAGRSPSVKVFGWCGVLLGICVLFSSFAAIMLTAMTAVVAAGLLVARGDSRRIPAATVAGAVPAALAVAAAFKLQYVDRSGAELLRFLVNPQAITNPVTSILLSFGPLLIPAVLGLVLAIKRRFVDVWIIGVIVVVSWFFYFFVDLRGHQYVYVGWRAGHFLFVAFAVLTAYALQELRPSAALLRRAGAAVVVICALLGVPTFAIDVYNTQDLSNRMQTPGGFKWTLVLSHDELKALDWVRKQTPDDAIVQVEPFTRDQGTWAYVPAFAERRMAAGLPISMVPVEKYSEASEGIRRIFRTLDPEEAYAIAARARIDYLWIGHPEREAYPDLEARLLGRPDLFRRTFHSGDVSIFFLERSR